MEKILTTLDEFVSRFESIATDGKQDTDLAFEKEKQLSQVVEKFIKDKLGEEQAGYFKKAKPGVYRSGAPYANLVSILENRKNFLNVLKDNIKIYPDVYVPTFSSVKPSEKGVWDLLHPRVVQFSQKKIKAGFYADAVETVFKQINSDIKVEYKIKTGQEKDGVQLMRSAFGGDQPLIPLNHLLTEDDRNIHEGYMHIFAGSMQAIRNPKAHGNIIISEENAIHLLFIASQLYYMLDNAGVSY